MKLPSTLRLAQILIVAAITGTALFLILQKNQFHEPSRQSVIAPHERGGAGSQGSPTTGLGGRITQQKDTGDSTNHETARELLNRFYVENSDIEKRSRFCSDLIAKLCRSGRSSEAWALIDSGYGNIRRSGMVSYFASSNESTAELVAKMRELDPKSDFHAVYTGLAFRFPLNDLVTFLTSGEFRKFSDEVKGYDMKNGISNSLSGSLQLALLRAEDQSRIIAAFEGARDLHDAGFLNQEMFMNLLTKKNTGDSFTKWGFVEGLDQNAEWGIDALQARREIIRGMISEDASKAIEKLLKDDGTRSEADIHSAVSVWSSMDSRGAAEWFAARKGTLNANQLDRVASGFSNAAMESKEFESARLWAEQVTNSEAKGKLLGEISQFTDSK